MSMTYPDLETVWPGWKIEAILGKGLGGSVYRAVRSVNGIVMKSAVKIMVRPEDRCNSEHPQPEGIQDRFYFREFRHYLASYQVLPTDIEESRRTGNS